METRVEWDVVLGQVGTFLIGMGVGAVVLHGLAAGAAIAWALLGLGALLKLGLAARARRGFDPVGSSPPG